MFSHVCLTTRAALLVAGVADKGLITLNGRVSPKTPINIGIYLQNVSSRGRSNFNEGGNYPFIAVSTGYR